MTTLVRPIRLSSKRSINAKRVAEKVIEKVRKGDGKVVMADIIREVGYSETMSQKPSKITSQSAYKETMEPFLESLKSLRNKTIAALHSKDLPTEKVYDLTQLLKQTTHDTQLLEGKATENVATKAEIVVFGSDDFLARQLEAKNGNGSVKP